MIEFLSAHFVHSPCQMESLYPESLSTRIRPLSFRPPTLVLVALVVLHFQRQLAALIQEKHCTHIDQAEPLQCRACI